MEPKCQTAFDKLRRLQEYVPWKKKKRPSLAMADFIGFTQAFKIHFSPLLVFVRENNGKYFF